MPIIQEYVQPLSEDQDVTVFVRLPLLFDFFCIYNRLMFGVLNDGYCSGDSFLSLYKGS